MDARSYLPMPDPIFDKIAGSGSVETRFWTYFFGSASELFWRTQFLAAASFSWPNLLRTCNWSMNVARAKRCWKPCRSLSSRIAMHYLLCLGLSRRIRLSFRSSCGVIGFRLILVLAGARKLFDCAQTHGSGSCRRLPRLGTSAIWRTRSREAKLSQQA